MFTEKFLEWQLTQDPEFDEDQEYLVDMARDLRWSYKNDSSIAYIRRAKNPDYKEKEKHEFDEYVYEQQFLRWAQVVDTDYDNYLVLWHCWEHAEYYDTAKAKTIPPSQIWKETGGGKRLPKGSHTPVEFELPPFGR